MSINDLTHTMVLERPGELLQNSELQCKEVYAFTRREMLKRRSLPAAGRIKQNGISEFQ